MKALFTPRMGLDDAVEREKVLRDNDTGSKPGIWCSGEDAPSNERFMRHHHDRD